MNRQQASLYRKLNLKDLHGHGVHDAGILSQASYPTQLDADQLSQAQLSGNEAQ